MQQLYFIFRNFDIKGRFLHLFPPKRDKMTGFSGGMEFILFCGFDSPEDIELEWTRNRGESLWIKNRSGSTATDL